MHHNLVRARARVSAMARLRLCLGLGLGLWLGLGLGLGLEAHHNVEDVEEGIPQHPPLPGLGLGVGIGVGLGLGLKKSAYATLPVVPRYTSVAYGESTVCGAGCPAPQARTARLRHSTVWLHFNTGHSTAAQGPPPAVDASPVASSAAAPG